MFPKKAKLYVGTSGFSYAHWEQGVFYPKGLPKTKQLEYYARDFNTVELNNPFYRLPTAETFSHWRDKTPKGFIFAVKVSRFITHIKRFTQCQKPWPVFLQRALNLKEKLGVFLFQLPPNFRATKENVKRLEEFLDLLRKTSADRRYAFEFRHQSWFSDDVRYLFKRHRNTSLCLIDSSKWPAEETITGNFIYIRMHGSKALYSSNYSKEELKNWAQKIKEYLSQRLDVYIYFNNDVRGYAIKNAKELLRFSET